MNSLERQLMIPDHIQAWINSGESETLELKSTTGERKEAAKSVCAMLNNRGGRVIIGVQPDGTIVGQKIGEQTIERLCQELNRIDPPTFPSVDREDVGNGRELLIVSVSQGQNKPYTYQRDAYRRVGNTNHLLSRDQYNQLLLERLHGEYRWENEPAPDWMIDDLDHAEIIRSVREAILRGRVSEASLGSSEPEELLRGLGLIRDGRLLRAGVVLFRRQGVLVSDYPQCLLRVARFRGTNRTEFLDNRQFHGNAFYLLQMAERFLQENLPIAGRIMPGVFERIDEPLYPPTALREALANAFCHRDYSIGGGSVAVAIYDDRLEITSSGTLHFGLTPKALFDSHESLPWNPIIADVFYRRGIIESWGRGINKMVELVTLAGLPEPEITEAAGCVTVTFRPSKYIPPQRVGHSLTERQRVILSILSDASSGLLMSEISVQLTDSLTPRQIRSDLNTLRSLDLVTLEGRGRSARWRLS